MLCARVLRRFRPGVAPLSVGNTHGALARHDAPFTGAVRAFHRTSRDVERLLVLNYKSPYLLVRPVSTVTHSEDGNLIYTGSLGSAIRGVKLFSYSTSGVSLLLIPYILQKTGLGVESFASVVVTYGIIGFLAFVTPVLLHLVTKGYVTRLYHKPDRDTYTAITYSLFLTEKKSVFHQRQVKIPAVSKMFTTFYADHVGLLVNPDLFPVPHDYNHLMGYDKPFIFDTDSMNGPNKD